MNKLIKKSLVLTIVTMISFLFIRLIINYDSSYLESITLLSVATTLLFIFINYKVSSYITSLFYLISFLIKNFFNLKDTSWFIIYVVVIFISFLIERKIKND